MRVADERLAGTAGELRATRVMPGLEGFWVFIGVDLLVFTLLFFSFMNARVADVGLFTDGQSQLSSTRGGINTLLLLTSSWCVALGLTAVRAGRRQSAARFLGWGLAGGLGFVASKVWEYAVELDRGYGPGSSDFFMYYYTLTGIHLAHVLVGCLLLALLLRSWRRQLPTRTEGAESIACYWHLVDFLWIVIFPLLYLVR
jgi:nitric oxide reductase NorE protein